MFRYRISVAPVGKEWDTEGEHSDIISVTTDTGIQWRHSLSSWGV